MSNEQVEVKVFYVPDKKKLATVLATPSQLLNAGAKLVLLHLITYTGKHYYCWPAQKTIANKLGMSDRQVRYHLTDLINAGVIEKLKKGYRVPLSAGGNYSRSSTYDLSAVLIKKESLRKDSGNALPNSAEK